MKMRGQEGRGERGKGRGERGGAEMVKAKKE